MGLAEVKRATGEAEFRKWALYWRHEPPVGERLDSMLGQLLAALINPHRGKGQAAVRPEQLTPRRWPVRLGDADTLSARLRAWAARHAER